MQSKNPWNPVSVTLPQQKTSSPTTSRASSHPHILPITDLATAIRFGSNIPFGLCFTARRIDTADSVVVPCQPFTSEVLVMAEFDLVVKNGMVVDGTRAPRFRSDIGIKNGRIAKIGRISSHEGAKVVDADGQIVAPGFN